MIIRTSYAGIASVLITLIWSFICSAQEQATNQVSAPVIPNEIINQNIYTDSANACGPSALLNSIKFGDSELRSTHTKLLGQNDAAKLRYLVHRYYKSRRSTFANEHNRWMMHGILCRDLEIGCNEFLKEYNLETCRGEFLDRKSPEETDEEHLARIHKWMKTSLEAGFPPILSIRSFVVRSREENDRKPKLEYGMHHYVMISSVPKILNSKIGFEAGIVDSIGGEQTSIFIHPEPNRQPFSVVKGNSFVGKVVDGRPFLLITSPKTYAIRPRNLEWSERFIVIANFMIGRF